MSAGASAARCPSCGLALLVPPPLGPAPNWWGCPRCGHIVPVVAARDPPPLFSWEVFPHLYPPLAAPARPRAGIGRAIAAMLIVGGLLLGALGGIVAAEGGIDLASDRFTLAGEVGAINPALVVPPPSGGGPAAFPTIPVAGARIVVTPSGGSPTVLVSNASGDFSLLGLPPGQTIVNVSAAGYAPASYALFFSAGYSTAGSPGDPLHVVLTPAAANGSSGTPSTQALSPFADLEGLVAALWSTSALLFLGAAIVLSAAVVCLKRRRDALAVAAGATTASAPVSLFLLPVAQAFPWIGLGGAATIAFGVVVATIGALRLVAVGWAPEPEPD